VLHSQVTCIMYMECIIVYTHVYHAHVSGAHLRSRRDFPQSGFFIVNTKCAIIIMLLSEVQITLLSAEELQLLCKP